MVLSPPELSQLEKIAGMAPPEKILSHEEELSLISAYVRYYRLKNGIRPTSGYIFKPECSCFAFGEGHNLLYRQLMTTYEGEGSWIALSDAGIRSLVVAEVKKEIERILPTIPKNKGLSSPDYSTACW